jgi:hypothetical protein
MSITSKGFDVEFAEMGPSPGFTRGGLWQYGFRYLPEQTSALG